MDVKGKVGFVTGATKGIGRAIAESFVRAGMHVCITARDEAEIERTVAALSDLGDSHITGVACDVRNHEEVVAAVEHCVEELGGLDVLVNNAGIGSYKLVEETSPEEFRAVLETNVFGVFYCCHEAIPIMKSRKGGHIINISSLAGTNAHPRMAAYNASKFGLNGFSEALMQEVRHDGIKVSYIMPGSVNTHFGGEAPSEQNSWQLQPEDIAEVVMDLLDQKDRALTSRVEIRPSRPPQK
jgi:NAD(P)-dependent dehydrogenase (short-subunit alcohol dehydrogenase family)